MCVAGIAAWTCHQPSSVFDVVPGDLVSSSILAAAAATTQVSHMHRLSCHIMHCLPAEEGLSHLFACGAVLYIEFSWMLSPAGWSLCSWSYVSARLP